MTLIGYFVLQYMHVEIHASARRHRVRDVDIRHAVTHSLVVVDIDTDSDPPRVLCIGPDRAGNLIEVVWLDLTDDHALEIHSMKLRRSLYNLLAEGEANR